MGITRKAQSMVPEKVVQILLILAVLIVLLVIAWIIFTDKGAKIWNNIVDFMRFGTG